MKKFIIAMTGLAMAVIPTVTVISCGNNSKKHHNTTPLTPLTPSTRRIPVGPINTALQAISDIKFTGQSGSGTFIMPSWDIPNTQLLFGQSPDETTAPSYSTSVLTNLSNDKYLWITARANTGYVFDGVLVPMKIKISGLHIDDIKIPVGPVNSNLQGVDPGITGQSGSGTFIMPSWDIPNTQLLFGQSPDEITAPSYYHIYFN